MKRAILGLASLPALAQSLAGPNLAAPSGFVIKLGGQADSGQGQAVQGKLTWNASEALTLFVSGVRSTLASSSQAPSPSGNDTLTTSLSLGGDYAFGAFSLGLQVDHSEMSDLLRSRRYSLQPAFEVGLWRLGLEGSLRTTEFDQLTFNNVAINTLHGTVVVSGTADLSLNDSGLGASLTYDGERWRPYGSYTRYHYGSYHGKTQVSRMWDAGGQVSPAIFMAMSGRLVNRLERMSATRLNRRATLLDSTATVGIEAQLTRTRWGLEVNRDRDHLTNLASDTTTAIAEWRVNARFALALQVGTTRSEVFGTDRFAGLSFTYRTRPNLLDLIADRL